MKNLLPMSAVVLAMFAVTGPARAASCLIDGPGWTSCAGFVTFSAHTLSGPFKPFQASSGTGSQADITVSFSSGVEIARVWINDPDYSGNWALFEVPGFCCYYLNFQGDRKPGFFTVESGGLGPPGPFTEIHLQSDNSDYVNWRVEYKRTASSSWCKITSSTTNCGGVTATTSPFHQGSPFDPFQSTAGTGTQQPIDITLGVAVASVTVTAVDPDFAGNRMEAYSATGAYLGSVNFVHDGAPGVTTTSTKSIGHAAGIKRIRLVPAANDYVAYQGVTATPPSCGDNFCNGSESCSSCPWDCCTCNFNGLCEPPDENELFCPEDCCEGEGEESCFE